MILKYLNDTTEYEVEFKKKTSNVVEIIGEFPIQTDGFTLSRQGHNDNWDYSAYTTVYREVEGGVQFSNDGSVMPIPIIKFVSSDGGWLDGSLEQESFRYEDLEIPTPTAYEDYEFVGWQPSIPSDGYIDYNEIFLAVFNSTLEEEEQPTLEDRVAVLEDDVNKINDALGG